MLESLSDRDVAELIAKLPELPLAEKLALLDEIEELENKKLDRKSTRLNSSH